MKKERVHDAENWLGWPPIPRPPVRFHTTLDVARRALADYVNGDASARRRLAEAFDEVVSRECFPGSPLPFRVALLTRAGIAHNWCGVGESSDTDLLAARKLLMEGLRITPLGGPEQAWLEYGLGNTLVNLFQRAGGENRLSDALDHARRSVSCAGNDQRLAALCRAGLASTLGTRFRVHGDAAVLAEAVSHAEWSATTAGDTQLGHRFAYILAELLATRYDASGSLDDLHRAIELLRGAGESRDYIMAPRTGNAFRGTLGSLLRRLYLRTRDGAVLDEAIRVLKEEVGDDDSRADPVSLSLLGNALLTRYQSFGGRGDLLRAVDLQMKTLNARRAGDWQLASGHNNAGNALASAWRETGDDQFGTAAVAHYRTALALTSQNAPERASRAYNLGSTLQARSVVAGGDELIKEAVSAYRDAVGHGLDSSPEWALAAARRWGQWAVARECWEEACEAYGGGLEAGRWLFRTQLLREDKETWLADSQGMPSEAAYALVRTGRWKEAVEVLETGRSMLLSEVLEADRTGLHQLADSDHAELVDRYRATTAALNRAMRDGASPVALRRLRGAVDGAIADIRLVEGFERFLTPPDFAEICRAVPQGAILVYLAAAERAGVAVTVDHTGRITAVELPSLTTAAVERRVGVVMKTRRSLVLQAGAWKGALDAVTRWAWLTIVSPVLPILDEAEDLIIVPSGKLTLLPLHAAWRPLPDLPGARHYLLDERTVRYVPNARALEFTQRTAAGTHGDRVLVAADPQPSSRLAIAYTRTEAAWARRWFAHSEVLRGDKATPEAVASALSRNQVHHFICHGRSDTDSPLDSALVLADDRELTLRAILSMRLGHPGAGGGARLTVLAACDTDQPGTPLPDEVVSLPTGLIQAGVAGVIAAQWAVRSETMSLLTARFYQLWRSEGREPALALRLAQRWMRDTTNAEKIRDLTPALTPSRDDEDLEELVRSLRLRDPHARSATHPADWAALSFHGS
ncbi:CHAT domain-containing protein [Streptomyces agglomeratus]|uniref:CHAT domain-containing protein n=1 Tax=Streptomyces agglomeratus TaxID=285458 RepID=UPI00159F0797|nr:CHAT domain-containing protein [Streptomyces agglomeratus]